MRDSTKMLYAVLIVLLVATFILTASCGYRETARSGCHIDTQTCDNLFGRDERDNQDVIDGLSREGKEARDRLDGIERDVKNIQKEIDGLTIQVNYLIDDAKNSSMQLSLQNSLLTLLQQQITAQGSINSNQQAQLDNINDQIVTITSYVDYQNVRIADMLTDIANLQLSVNALNAEDTVIQYVYPCGDRAGIYDEMFLQTKSGKLIAFFEDGGSRHLTFLQPSAYYRTTDRAPYCYFNTDANLHIVNAHR